MSTLRTLILQANILWNDPEGNREHLRSLLGSNGAEYDLAVLPETFTTGFTGDADMPAETMDGPTVSWMVEICERNDAALAGSIVVSEDGQRFNRLLFVTPDGVQAWYDKRHLFSYGGEDERYTAGTQRVITDYKGWRINLQTCYDLRFPVWCRNRDDYDLMLMVANWPARRIHHWSALLEARAIENQAWVIGVNRAGQDGNGLVYPGASAVHSPMGETLVRFGDGEQSRIVKLDLSVVEQMRKKFPFQQDADEFELHY
jgi:predicted amidohydrolase